MSKGDEEDENLMCPICDESIEDVTQVTRPVCQDKIVRQNSQRGK